MPILQALLRSAAEYFAYLVSLGCRNEALSGAHFFKISLCSIFAKNIANLVSLEICKQISARSLSLACALIGHYLGSLLQARHVFFLSAFTARWSKKYIFFADNQKCQAGFRPLCNKILVLGLFTATKFKIIVVWFFTCAVKSIVGFWGRKLQREWDFYQVASTGNVSCSYLPHTVILEIFNLKENAISNFAFQSSKIFIGTQNKKNFWKVMILFEGQY